MAKGKLPEAEKILAQVESAKVRYPVLHFGDTPTRLRRDLQKLRASRGQGIAAKQTKTAKNAPIKNPFVQALKDPEAARNSSHQRQPEVAVRQPVTDLRSLPEVAAGSRSRVQHAEYQAVVASPPASHRRQGVAVASNTVPVNLTLPDITQETALPLRTAQIPEEAFDPLPTPAAEEVLLPQPASPFDLLQAGERALRSGDRSAALDYFRAAHAQRNQLDPFSQEQLQDHLQMLATNPAAASRRGSQNSLLNTATSEQTVIARQLSAEIGKRQSEAAQVRKSDPERALEILEEAKELIRESTLGQGMQSQLSRRVDLSIAETEKYISDNQAELELEAANRKVLEDIDRDREVRIQVQQRLAELVEEFEALRDEQRFAEMEVVAKRAYDMAPEDLVAQLIWREAKFIRRSMLNREIDELTEGGVISVLQDARMSAGEALVTSTSPITYGASWDDLVKNRRGSSERDSRQTKREIEIQRKLRTPVLPRYKEMPLTEVMDALSELSGVNIHLDPRGLRQEGIRSDEQVSLYLPQEISLESALTLILEPLHLTYVIQDEVLKVTSEQIRDGETYVVNYNVADLVIPIPNFVPSSSMGLQGMIDEAYQSLPVGVGAHSGDGPVVVMSGNPPAQPGGPVGANVMPQQFGVGAGGNSAVPPLGGMPGNPGGAALADFDSLIDLIVSTVEHDTWMENGTGEGEIQPFPTNLSLVVSQTQPVHEQIADLLEQLRRLQDLQVTIEVRFIRLTDNFFERIGIDFDFNVEDSSGITDLNNVNSTFEPRRSSATVGITANPIGIADPLGTFSADLDIPIRQDSFSLSGAPGFTTPATVGEFGFAILSDIEAYFLIQASQADQRQNILNAPKVTLFNGQQATVIDAAQVPFVISVIPVVGEFAAAQQPVIVVLSEGTMMTVQAVVSDDRRYVRLTLVPFFSQIGDVQTFTFEGSETTTTSSNTTDADDDGNNESDDNTNNVIRSGTTVQLPTFEVISVSTTVSVPDGGTVLLGGIKRLSEGRNEAGIPLLSKVPYIDRLFRNVGIGRNTDSLMMMVTPHIIIQEEEEERLGGSSE
ncbi:MAG: general secretion pathway protein GspD [Pirellulales bacterium]|nr:general secretion pathway protein GspD [Pirellulales bacterium]